MQQETNSPDALLFETESVVDQLVSRGLEGGGSAKPLRKPQHLRSRRLPPAAPVLPTTPGDSDGDQSHRNGHSNAQRQRETTASSGSTNIPVPLCVTNTASRQCIEPDAFSLTTNTASPQCMDTGAFSLTTNTASPQCMDTGAFSLTTNTPIPHCTETSGVLSPSTADLDTRTALVNKADDPLSASIDTLFSVSLSVPKLKLKKPSRLKTKLLPLSNFSCTPPAEESFHGTDVLASHSSSSKGGVLSDQQLSGSGAVVSHRGDSVSNIAQKKKSDKDVFIPKLGGCINPTKQMSSSAESVEAIVTDCVKNVTDPETSVPTDCVSVALADTETSVSTDCVNVTLADPETSVLTDCVNVTDPETSVANDSVSVSLADPETSVPTDFVSVALVDTETSAPTDSVSVTLADPETSAPTDCVNVTDPETSVSTDFVTVADPDTSAPTDSVNVTDTETSVPTDRVNVTDTEISAPTDCVNVTDPETFVSTDFVTVADPGTSVPTDYVSVTLANSETSAPTDYVSVTLANSETSAPTDYVSVTLANSETSAPTDSVTVADPETSVATDSVSVTLTDTETSTPTDSVSVAPADTETSSCKPSGSMARDNDLVHDVLLEGSRKRRLDSAVEKTTMTTTTCEDDVSGGTGEGVSTDCVQSMNSDRLTRAKHQKLSQKEAPVGRCHEGKMKNTGNTGILPNKTLTASTRCIVTRSKRKQLMSPATAPQQDPACGTTTTTATTTATRTTDTSTTSSSTTNTSTANPSTTNTSNTNTPTTNTSTTNNSFINTTNTSTTTPSSQSHGQAKIRTAASSIATRNTNPSTNNSTAKTSITNNSTTTKTSTTTPSSQSHGQAKTRTESSSRLVVRHRLRRHKRIIVHRQTNMLCVSCKHGFLSSECLLCLSVNTAAKLIVEKASAHKQKVNGLHHGSKAALQSQSKRKLGSSSNSKAGRDCATKNSSPKQSKNLKKDRVRSAEKGSPSNRKDSSKRPRSPCGSVTLSAAKKQRVAAPKAKDAVKQKSTPLKRSQQKGQSTSGVEPKQQSLPVPTKPDKTKQQMREANLQQAKERQSHKSKRQSPNMNSNSGSKPKQNSNSGDKPKPKKNFNSGDKTKPKKNFNSGDKPKPKNNFNSGDAKPKEVQVLEHHKQLSSQTSVSDSNPTFTSAKDMFAQLCQLQEHAQDYDSRTLQEVMPQGQGRGQGLAAGERVFSKTVSVYSSATASSSHVGGVWKSIFSEK